MSCNDAPAKFNCHHALQDAIRAYHALMVGQTRIRVRHGESEVEYDKRNINALKQYIMSLHQSCPSMEAAAVLGIPQRRAPGIPFHGSFDFPLNCCGPVEPDCSVNNCGCV